jgi:hypothetical protein
MAAARHDYDWLVIGSRFGGSTSPAPVVGEGLPGRGAGVQAAVRGCRPERTVTDIRLARSRGRIRRLCGHARTIGLGGWPAIASG